MPGPLRVLHVIGGSEFGGAVWIILGYIRMLQDHGCQVFVISSNDAVAGVYRDAGCEVVPIQEMHREIHPIRDLVAIKKIADVCRRYRVDAVHTHTSKGGFVGRAAAWLTGVPIILHTAHGFAFHELSSASTIRAYAALERLAAYWCDKIITVSDFHRDWALRLHIAPPDKIVTVHNGISLDRLRISRDRDAIRAELGIRHDALLIGTLGRLAPQKGLENLLDAMPFILKKEPQAMLLVVGKGPLSDDLQERARRLEIEDHVTFAGFRLDIGDVTNACDLVVSPTLREGLSVSLLEALALGKPIVTTNISSNCEIIEDHISGLLVPPGDVYALCDAILSVIADPGSGRKYGIAAKERYDLFFTEKKMQSRLWEVYADIIRLKMPPNTNMQKGM